MTAHREARTPTAAIGACHTAYNNDAAIARILLARVWIISLATKLLHGRGRVLQGEERGQRVRLEAFLQIRGRGKIDAWRA